MWMNEFILTILNEWMDVFICMLMCVLHVRNHMYVCFYEFQNLPSVKSSSPSKTVSNKEGGEQQGGGRAIGRRTSKEEGE